jgi:hypothetical protein
MASGLVAMAERPRMRAQPTTNDETYGLTKDYGFSAFDDRCNSAQGN